MRATASICVELELVHTVTCHPSSQHGKKSSWTLGCFDSRALLICEAFRTQILLTPPPKSSTTLLAAGKGSCNCLQDEAAKHRDLLIVPGTEEYNNLGHKTLNILRYAAVAKPRYVWSLHLVITLSTNTGCMYCYSCCTPLIWLPYCAACLFVSMQSSATQT